MQISWFILLVDTMSCTMISFLALEESHLMRRDRLVLSHLDLLQRSRQGRQT